MQSYLEWHQVYMPVLSTPTKPWTDNIRGIRWRTKAFLMGNCRSSERRVIVVVNGSSQVVTNIYGHYRAIVRVSKNEAKNKEYFAATQTWNVDLCNENNCFEDSCQTCVPWQQQTRVGRERKQCNLSGLHIDRLLPTITFVFFHCSIHSTGLPRLFDVSR